MKGLGRAAGAMEACLDAVNRGTARSERRIAVRSMLKREVRWTSCVGENYGVGGAMGDDLRFPRRRTT